jgi:hypothetical protein
MGSSCSSLPTAGATTAPARWKWPLRKRSAAHVDNVWVLDDPVQRQRVITDFYDLDSAVVGEGHYGKVRLAHSRPSSVTAKTSTVAIKTVLKKRPVYVELLRTEIAILR